MRVAKWGNSLAVRLPRPVVEALGLKEGDEIEVRLPDKRTLEISQAPTVEEIVERLRKYEGRAPARYRFTRSDAYEE